MQLKSIFYFGAFLLQTQTSNCANILFYFGVSTYSHRVIVWPLVDALVARGDNVTFLSPYAPKNPNPKVHEIYNQKLALAMQAKPQPDQKEEISLVHKRMENKHMAAWDLLFERGLKFCQAVTESPEIVHWVNTSSYDLVVIDALFNECGLGLAYKFRAPHISFVTTTVFQWIYDIFGFPAETSWIPDLAMGYPREMTFIQRVSNTFRPLYWHFSRHRNLFPQLEEMLRATFDMPDMPPLKVLEREASLVLLNSHFSFDYARSLPPLVVPVGGMQCKRNDVGDELPKDIKDFIEAGGDEGFVYVSFGSNVQFSKIPHHIKNIFFEAFRNSSVRFVWKWESEVPKEMPENVITAKWMPQNDILAHPKIKAFITHSGLGGTQEAICHGVPMLAFPIFAEQDYNAEIIANQRIGIRLEITELTLPKLETAIQDILTDNRYKIKMTETSRIFRDRPMTALETAVWWTEYTLRNSQNRTESYLLPLGAKQTWYERRGLDVWAVVLIAAAMCFVSISLASYWVLKRILYYLPNNSTASKSILKQKNL